MMRLAEKIQKANWKKERNVPSIFCPDTVDADTWKKVTVSLGKAVDHLNTAEYILQTF
jgi:desulfoferrodoxin (superoxide reductase-like protein)